ncbi:hypothetical protein CMV_025515 [Castanea mollissima]|uniref:Uncharacterized protein n=1 Tax=Castanea mollissima TaxID=60419 RepID=A0A8J4QDA4_9ROSI|nr:hypothetical protein CMV_025515 [Castanea mollissima]
MPLYLYTSDFILSLCLCFLHRYQSALKFTSSSESYVSDSNFIPSLLNSRDIAPLDVNGDVGVSNKDCEW